MDLEHIIEKQKKICLKYNAEYRPLDFNSIVGVAVDTLSEIPIHGLRHIPEKETCGWYIWGGSYSENDDFFQPLHAFHLINSNEKILKYLAFPPGWRFLFAENYEDVWFDKSII